MTMTTNAHYDDIYIREVRATYHLTSQKVFPVGGPEEAAEFIRSVLTDNSREHFVALYLDGRHRVASYSLVAIGTANSCPVHPWEIL